MIPLRTLAGFALLAFSVPAFADCAEELAALEGTGASETTVAQAAMPGADPSVEQETEAASSDEADAGSDDAAALTGGTPATADDGPPIGTGASPDEEVPQAVMPGADPSVQQDAEASAEAAADKPSAEEIAIGEAREHLEAGRESECLAALERARSSAQ